MPSFFSAEDQAAINQVFEDVHDSFKKEIYVYTESIQAQDSYATYNPLFGRNEDAALGSYETILSKETIYARVYYPEQQKQEPDQFKAQVNIPLSQGRCRIKVDYTGLQKVLNASKIEVDNVLWVVDGDAKPVGPFSPEFYSIFLRREN